MKEPDSSPHKRKKQPELVRANLLKAAASIALEQGVNAVTLEAVAQHAGVSKGGLQYHFRSKDELLYALFNDAFEAAKADTDKLISLDNDSYGREARAYLKATIEDMDRGSFYAVWRMLLAVMMNEPKLRKDWGERMILSNTETDLTEEEAAKMIICRLASDGLMLNQLLGVLNLSDSLKSEVFKQLEAMTRK